MSQYKYIDDDVVSWCWFSLYYCAVPVTGMQWGMYKCRGLYWVSTGSDLCVTCAVAGAASSVLGLTVRGTVRIDNPITGNSINQFNSTISSGHTPLTPYVKSNPEFNWKILRIFFLVELAGADWLYVKVRSHRTLAGTLGNGYNTHSLCSVSIASNTTCE